MPTDPRLAAIPALRRLSEEDVRDTWARHVRLFRTSAWAADSTWVDDPDDAPDAFAVCVDAAVEKLADMERPASRDALARLIAEARSLSPAEVHRDIAGGSWSGACRFYGLPRDTADPGTEAGRATAIALHVLGRAP